MLRARFAGLPLALVGVALALTAAAYPWLPDTIVVHWSAAGRPNGFAPRLSAFLIPLLMFTINVVLSALPGLSPSGYGPGTSASLAQRRIQVATMLVMLALQAYILGKALGLIGFAPQGLTFAAVGGLMLVMGNYLGKLRQNFFLGIRTPWTLTDPEVWARTHRLGGKLMVPAGLVLVALAFVPAANAHWLLAIVLTATLVPCVYSFVIYRRLHAR
jgi:uncharacterized membrane protein